MKPKQSITPIIAISYDVVTLEALNHSIYRYIGVICCPHLKPIFVKPKLSISNVNAISDDLVTFCPYCHELVLK